MSFSFGTTPQQPATPAPFGGFGAAKPSTGFGGFGATTTQPSTGFTGFGAATSQPAATGFTGFGATTSQPAAGGGFGGFGTTTQTQPNTGFSGFGAAPAATQATTGFTGFGAAASTAAAPTGFSGFGAPASTAATGFGGGFTQPKPAFGTSTFGGGGTSGGLFGGTSTGFGATTSTTSGGLFGGGGGGLFSQPQPPPQQQQPAQPGSTVDTLYNAVLHCSLYGDERDAIIARWNMLQASWGTGKAYYANNAPPVELKQDNPFCRFKAIGYSAIPKHSNEAGLVCLIFKKKSAEIEAGKEALTTSLNTVLGNKPNVKASVESIKATAEDRSDVVISVKETAVNGSNRKIPASELSGFLAQPAQAQQLKNLGVENVLPKLEFSEADIKEYLATPPQGIDARLWKQAQLDNPSPKKLLPVPMIGFKSLQQRIRSQEGQSKSHQGRLDLVAEDIATLQRRHQDTLAALGEAKRRQLELSHRLLKVLVNQESTRKLGFTIQPEEERLRGQLEALQSELATPTQFKGRLNELLSQVRLQSTANALAGGEKYNIDQNAMADIKVVLKDQQHGIQALVGLVKEDLRDIGTMVEGLAVQEQKA